MEQSNSQITQELQSGASSGDGLNPTELEPKFYSKNWFKILLAFLIFGTVPVALLYQNFQLRKQVLRKSETIGPEVTLSPTAFPTSTTDEIASWKTYTNNEYSFSLRYPPSYSIWKPQSPHYYLEIPLISFISRESKLKALNYQQEAVLTISVKADSPSGCYTQPTNKLQFTETRDIGGLTFKNAKSGGAALGSSYETTIYRTVKENSCFEIALSISATSDWNEIDLKEADESKAIVGEELNRILSTFKFLGQSTLPTLTIVPKNTEDTEVRNLIAKFEKYVQDRDINALMSLFTPPETNEEKEIYNSIMGFDAAGPRLFNNVSSNYILLSWKVARREYPGNAEIITKEDSKYTVVVEETRKGWDPVIGGYSEPNSGFYVFEVVKENTQWLVELTNITGSYPNQKPQPLL